MSFGLSAFCGTERMFPSPSPASPPFAFHTGGKRPVCSFCAAMSAMMSKGV